MRSTYSKKNVCKLSFRQNNRGMALIIALVLISVLALIGTFAVKHSTTDIKIGTNYKESTKDYFAAMAGTEEMRSRLRGTSTSSNFIGDTSSPESSVWSTYIRTSIDWAVTDDPNYDATYTNTLKDSAQADIDFWSKIRHKLEYDAEQDGHTTLNNHYYDGDGDTGTHTAGSPGNIVYYGYGDPSQPTTAVQFTSSTSHTFKPVEIITSNGGTGNSEKELECEVVRNSGPPITSALYSETGVTGNGSALSIDGNDDCGNADDLPPIYTVDPGTTTTHGSSPSYTGSPATPTSGSNDVDIAGYVDSLKDDAIVVTDSSYTFSSSYETYYWDTAGLSLGARTMTGITGYGVLLVEENIKLGGGFTWYGLIIVKGDVVMGGGGGDVNVFGAVLSESNSDIGGNVNISYDSCILDEALNFQSFKIIRWKQLYN